MAWQDLRTRRLYPFRACCTSHIALYEVERDDMFTVIDALVAALRSLRAHHGVVQDLCPAVVDADAALKLATEETA